MPRPKYIHDPLHSYVPIESRNFLVGVMHRLLPVLRQTKTIRSFVLTHYRQWTFRPICSCKDHDYHPMFFVHLFNACVFFLSWMFDVQSIWNLPVVKTGLVGIDIIFVKGRMEWFPPFFHLLLAFPIVHILNFPVKTNANPFVPVQHILYQTGWCGKLGWYIDSQLLRKFQAFVLECYPTNTTFVSFVLLGT